MSKGLTSAEANKRLMTLGYNLLSRVKLKSVWRVALEVVKEANQQRHPLYYPWRLY